MPAFGLAAEGRRARGARDSRRDTHTTAGETPALPRNAGVAGKEKGAPYAERAWRKHWVRS